MRHISFKVVFVAFVVTVFLDLMLGSLVWWLWFGGQAPTSPDSAPPLDAGYLAVGLLVGTFTTVVGGGVCARMARTLPYWHAAVFGVVGLVEGLLLASPQLQAWFLALSFLSTVPAALVGAHLEIQRARSANR